MGDLGEDSKLSYPHVHFECVVQNKADIEELCHFVVEITPLNDSSSLVWIWEFPIVMMSSSCYVVK